VGTYEQYNQQRHNFFILFQLTMQFSSISPAMFCGVVVLLLIALRILWVLPFNNHRCDKFVSCPVRLTPFWSQTKT